MHFLSHTNADAQIIVDMRREANASFRYLLGFVKDVVHKFHLRRDFPRKPSHEVERCLPVLPASPRKLSHLAQSILHTKATEGLLEP